MCCAEAVLTIGAVSGNALRGVRKKNGRRPLRFHVLAENGVKSQVPNDRDGALIVDGTPTGSHDGEQTQFVHISTDISHTIER
ncbi:hypothetical protein QTP88_012890 [Uroleucon formosanum]